MSTFFRMVLTRAFSLKNECLSDINVHHKGYGKDRKAAQNLVSDRAVLIYLYKKITIFGSLILAKGGSLALYLHIYSPMRNMIEED